MTIATKTGDGGESDVRGARLPKNAPVFQTLGDVDELNSWLGTVNRQPLPDWAADTVERVQRELLAMSASIAGYGDFASRLLPALERDIERHASRGEFKLVLPGGQIHVARTVCRRAERSLVALSPDHPGVKLLNRLSDWLFVLAEDAIRRQD